MGGFDQGWALGANLAAQNTGRKWQLADEERRGKAEPLIETGKRQQASLLELEKAGLKDSQQYKDLLQAYGNTQYAFNDLYHHVKAPGAIQADFHWLADKVRGFKQPDSPAAPRVTQAGQDGVASTTLPGMQGDPTSIPATGNTPEVLLGGAPAPITSPELPAYKQASVSPAAPPAKPVSWRDAELRKRQALAMQKAQQEAGLLAAGAGLSPEQQAVTKASADDVFLQAKLRAIDANTMLTPEEKEEQRRLAVGGSAKNVSENIKTFTLKLKDGREIPVMKDMRGNSPVMFLNNKPVPEDMLEGAQIAAKPVAVKGLQFDKNGQIVDKDTQKRYSPGDPNNPPQIAEMFRQQENINSRKEQFQIELTKLRGIQYGIGRSMQPLPVFDQDNGNAPTYATFMEMQKNPGRYIPASSGAKAITAENMMQDIMGTSKITRNRINALAPSEDFTPDMKAKIAFAIRSDDPHSAFDLLLSSGALGSLTDKQQDFLIATRQLAENAMAMRTILGAGQGSEDMRNAIRDTLPGLLSPNRRYALSQLDAFDATINRLHRGVPKVKLNNAPMDDTNTSEPQRIVGKTTKTFTSGPYKGQTGVWNGNGWAIPAKPDKGANK